MQHGILLLPMFVLTNFQNGPLYATSPQEISQATFRKVFCYLHDCLEKFGDHPHLCCLHCLQFVASQFTYLSNNCRRSTSLLSSALKLLWDFRSSMRNRLVSEAVFVDVLRQMLAVRCSLNGLDMAQCNRKLIAKLTPCDTFVKTRADLYLKSYKSLIH